MQPNLFSGFKTKFLDVFKKVYQIKEKSVTQNQPKEGFYNSTDDPELIQYRTHEIIGTGSFGVVYSAINHKGENIAIKCKKESKDVTLKVESNILFSKEIDTLSQLNHRNIVRLLGVEFNFFGPVSIVMEYLHGIDLEKVIQINRQLSEFIIKNYTTQLVDAISYLHSKNIIHRDIKSTNVMVVADIYIKLIDFGIAKKVKKSAYLSQAYTSTDIIGTLAYMAPELVYFDKYNAAIDVFSLGVLIFEMANGEPFFGPKTSPLPLFKAPSYLSLPNLSSMANNFIHNCLIKEYKLRPRASSLRLHPFLSN